MRWAPVSRCRRHGRWTAFLIASVREIAVALRATAGRVGRVGLAGIRAAADRVMAMGRVGDRADLVGRRGRANLPRVSRA